MKKDYSLLEFIFGITATLLSGLAIMVLWGWFFVPLGLVKIGFAHALGIDVLVTLIVTTSVPKIPTTAEDKIKRMVYGNLLPLFSLGMGFAIKLCM